MRGKKGTQHHEVKGISPGPGLFCPRVSNVPFFRMAKPLVYGFPSKGTERSNGPQKPLQLLRSPHTPSPLAFHKFCRPLRSVPRHWSGRAASWESASGFGLRGKGSPLVPTHPLYLACQMDVGGELMRV